MNNASTLTEEMPEDWPDCPHCHAMRFWPSGRCMQRCDEKPQRKADKLIENQPWLASRRRWLKKCGVIMDIEIETGGVTLADEADALFLASNFARAEDMYRRAEAIFRRNGHCQSAVICLRRAEQCVRLAKVF